MPHFPDGKSRGSPFRFCGAGSILRRRIILMPHFPDCKFCGIFSKSLCALAFYFDARRLMDLYHLLYYITMLVTHEILDFKPLRRACRRPCCSEIVYPYCPRFICGSMPLADDGSNYTQLQSYFALLIIHKEPVRTAKQGEHRQCATYSYCITLTASTALISTAPAVLWLGSTEPGALR